MKKHLSTIILVFVFLVGLSVVLYPTVSDYWNSRTQTRAIAAYQDSMKDMKPEDYTAYFEAAEDYNNRLRETPGAFTDPSLVAGYEDTLDISGTGVMGYITIEKSVWNCPFTMEWKREPCRSQPVISRARPCQSAVRAHTPSSQHTADCRAQSSSRTSMSWKKVIPSPSL